MTVYLVGAGPGDPGLMTARSLELIAKADVIIHDRLIPEGALAGARADAELIYAGKEGGGEQIPQETIDALLIEHGRRGGTVVRLKGGDPFVFGRGGEEAERLLAAGIEYEVVPGVTSGIAAPAYAGIPVTHRDLASSVAFVTGHEDPAKPESALDWQALAAFPGTIVVYMGVRQLAGITARLAEGGRPPDEPAALVHRGTLPGQRAVVATLSTLAEVAVREQIKAPSIAIFGPVAGLRDQLAWFERRPLSGVSVAVTRARAQASRLVGRLQALGANVVEAPVIKIRQLDGPVPELHSYDLIVLTSANGVEGLFARMQAAGLDARAFGSARVAVIGPGTARVLAGYGIRADIVPERFVAEGLVEALAGVPVRRALIARGSEGREVLPDALRERGAEVDVVALYDNVIEPLSSEQAAAVARCDYLTFTSASSVYNLARA
jgi:uroporphyrinogen III methyltransferase/synthase